ncbi:MAG: sigma-70 family RNA polymerase sigma factor [Pirellulaceae bacterium]
MVAEAPNNPASSDSYIRRDPDVRLMIGVRAGDAAAFEELVRKYQNRLVGILEHLVGNRHQAEDLAQEVFLRVYRARDKYEPKAKFSTWLFTIANNVARNAKRNLARRIQARPAGDGDGSSDLPLAEIVQAASGVMPTRQLEREEVGELVRLALASLGERQRMVLLLAKFENMNYDEIAETMGLSRSAVKSLALRARASLKEALEPYVRSGMM